MKKETKKEKVSLKYLQKEANRLKKLAAEMYRDSLDLIDKTYKEAIKMLPYTPETYTYEVTSVNMKTLKFEHLVDAWAHRLGFNAGSIYAVKDGVKRKIAMHCTRDPITGKAYKGYCWFFVDSATKLEFEIFILAA